MPLETAAFITDLVAANPVHTDPLSAADSHMRLIKQVLRNTFPNMSAALTTSSADLTYGVLPVGSIIIWGGGGLGTIPPGWFLCDGNNGTPNLLDRFVPCAGGSLAQGSVGGSVSTTADGSHVHPGGVTDITGSHAHNVSISGSGSGSTDAQGSHSHGGASQSHTLTIGEIPPHNHFGNATVVADPGFGTFWTSIPLSTTQALARITEATTGGGAGHNHGITADGSHGHNVTVTTSGSGGTDAQGTHQHLVSLTFDGTHTHTVLPPYIAIYYIMRRF
jgi:hypothetical protein